MTANLLFLVQKLMPSKAMIPSDFPLASRGDRFLAVLAEGGIFAVVGEAPIFASFMMADANGEPNVPLMFIGIALVLGLAIYNIILIFTAQQTIGKKMMGLRVVRADEVNALGVTTSGYVV